MVVSDEPGIYSEGMHGVRHENLLLCTDAGSNDFGNWLRFDSLSLCPFDTEPLIAEMLSPSEREWLNNYHASVYAALRPYLNDLDGQWLQRKTLAI